MMDEVVAPKPVMSVFGKSPNWHRNMIMGVDARLGVLYYCAERYVFALDATDLSYLASWVAHDKRATCLAVSPLASGPVLATGGEDGIVKLWAPKFQDGRAWDSQNSIFSHNRHKADINTISWSSDGQAVISGDASGRVIFWMPYTGTHHVTILTHMPLLCMDIIAEGERDLLAVGSCSGSIFVCELVAGSAPQVSQRISFKNSRVTCIKWRPRQMIAGEEQPALAATSDDGMIRVWQDLNKPPHKKSGVDAKVGKNLNRLFISLEWIVYENCTSILSSCPDGKLLVWSPFIPKPARTFAGMISHQVHSRPIFGLTIFPTPNGQRLASVGMDRIVALWDIEKNILIKSISTLGGGVRSLDFSPAQPELAAIAVSDALIRLWDHSEPSANLIRPLWRKDASSLSAVAFHPSEGGVLAFSNKDGIVGVYNNVFLDSPASDIRRKSLIFKEDHKAPVDQLQWVPMAWVTADSERDDLSASVLVSFSTCNKIQHNFYPLPDLVPILSPFFSMKIKTVRQIQFAANHAWVAVGYYSGHIKVFAMPAFSLVYSAACSSNPTRSLAWSQQDKILAAGHENGDIFLHNSSRFSIDENAAIAQYPLGSASLIGHGSKVTSLNWSPHDLNLLASCDISGLTYTWDVSVSKPTAAFNSGPALCVRLSPIDPNMVLTCADNAIVWQWNMALNPFSAFPQKKKDPVSDSLPTVNPMLSKKESWSSIITTCPIPLKAELLEMCLQPNPPVLEARDEPYYLKLWQGQVAESFEEMASHYEPQNDLTKWLLHLALSPLAGPEIYSEALLKTAQAYRSKNGNPQIAASLFASAGHIMEAIECLTSRGFYLDAVALAQSRLPSNHRHLVSLYQKYAQHLVLAKESENACRWFLLANDVTSAIDAIALPSTRDSLFLAMELSFKKNHETYPLRVWRYSIACQLEGVHSEATLVLCKFPPSPAIVACLLFTLTDEWYNSSEVVPVENDDIIDIDIELSDDDTPDIQELLRIWSIHGLSLLDDSKVLYQPKESTPKTFTFDEVICFLSSHIGDRTDIKGPEVLAFICKMKLIRDEI